MAQEPGNNRGAHRMFGWLTHHGIHQHSRSENRRRRSSSQVEASSKPSFKVRDLEDRHNTIKFWRRDRITPGSLLPHMREWYARHDKQLADGAVFEFFSIEGDEWPLDFPITTEAKEILYRVSSPQDSPDGWRFSRWTDRSDGPLEAPLATELAAAINGGATVRVMQVLIADRLGIDDPNCVILVARGGLRSGSLLGNDWEVRQVKTWLCRWIAIDVNPAGLYVVLRGLEREYLYHPKADCVSMDFKDLVSYVETRLLHGVHRHGLTRSKVPSDSRASLSLDGRAPEPQGTVIWGATYTFEVSDDVAEAFSTEEAWLLPKNMSCNICTDDKAASEMLKFTVRCGHPPTACRDCVRRWLASRIDGGRWMDLTCSECGKALDHHDMRRCASRETFERYDYLVTHDALNRIDEFRFCLSPTCNSGQMHRHDSDCPEFDCQACGARHCVRHNVPWHEGMTCAQYDARHPDRRRDENASEREVSTSSARCPGCGRVCYLYVGCNHITCPCGHEWCYKCGEPHLTNSRGLTYCRHKPGCEEYTNPVHLLNDPNRGDHGAIFRRIFDGNPPAPRPAAVPRPEAHRAAEAADGGGGGGDNQQFVPQNLRPGRHRQLRTPPPAQDPVPVPVPVPHALNLFPAHAPAPEPEPVAFLFTRVRDFVVHGDAARRRRDDEEERGGLHVVEGILVDPDENEDDDGVDEGAPGIYPYRVRRFRRRRLR